MRSIPVPLLAMAPFLLAGCAGAYFKDAGEAPTPPPRHELRALPFDEYWTGLVFNGEKIGFTHLEVREVADDEFELRSQAVMRFHFLAVDKEATLKAVDRVHGDLTIRRFAYDYDLDGNRLAIEGMMEDGALTVTVRARESVERQSLAPGGPVYPTSVIGLYPVVHGLGVGRRYEYLVYDGETRQLAPVVQEVLAFERSPLFEGSAFRVQTRLHGHEVTTWIGLDGRPLLERSMNGIFISGLETESMAKRYLALAALNKEEMLLELSTVRVEPPIPAPRGVSALSIELGGLDGFPVPSDALQTCSPSGERVHCEVRNDARADLPEASIGRWLESTLPAPSRAPNVRRLARSIVAGIQSRERQIEALVAWIQAHIEQVAVDVFSALDVLATRKAECQGNTYLYTAFARSLGIPTRVVNGLVYSELVDGFVYHTWAESLVDGRLIPVDPTFGQVRADATHIKLIEGETLAELVAIVGLIGRLEARVLSMMTAGSSKPEEPE